jgi:hypothetical protein
MRGERTIPLEDGPWTHLLDAGPGTEGSYQYGENVYPSDPVVADDLVGRPGRWRTNLDYVLAPAPSGGIRAIQAVGQLTLPFIQWTIAIVDGKFYTYRWSDDLWQGGPLPGVLTGLGITLDTDESVSLVQLRNGLLVSDGVNTPWVWDGIGFLAGNVTKLTNCPPLLGRPVVRDGRIFGIKASDPTKIVWSEVDQPNVGYEAGGYNNVWAVTQSNPNKLTALDADNAGLTLLRRRSATRVYGDDPQEFAAGNAEDSLDQRVGVVSSRAVVALERGILVLDGELKGQWLVPGAEAALPVWHGLKDTIATMAREAHANFDQPAEFLSARAIGVDWTPAGLVLFAVPSFSNDPQYWDLAGTSPESWIMVYDVRPSAPRAVGVWRGLGNIQSMAMVRRDTSSASDEYLMFGADGEIFVLGDPSETFRNDARNALTAAPQAIRHVVETRPLGYSTSTEKHFDRVDLLGSAPTPQTLSVEVLAPDLDAPPQTVVLPAATRNRDVKVEAGVEARGRYGTVRVTHQTLDEAFSLSALSLAAVVTGRNPGGR